MSAALGDGVVAFTRVADAVRKDAADSFVDRELAEQIGQDG